MGHLLDALRQIDDRAAASVAPRPVASKSASRVESSASLESAASSESPFAAIEESYPAQSVFAVIAEPFVAEDAFAAADEPRDAAAMPATPSGERRVSQEGIGATAPVDPRYRELLGAILARMNVQGDMVLLMAGLAEDEPRGGQLAAFYPILASRVEGGILVVDADAQHAGASRLLGSSPQSGLRDVLAGKVSWQDAIRETRHPGLFVLPEAPNPADSIPMDPSELSALMGVLRARHHLVVVDALVSSPKAAARWSTVCDAVVTVVRLGVASRRRVERTLDAMAARGTDVLGCVLLGP